MPNKHFMKPASLKLTIMLILVLGSLITAIWAVEDRYALKTELVALQVVLKQEREGSYNHLKDLILMQYEDEVEKLRKLKYIGGATPDDLTRIDTLMERIPTLRGNVR